MATFGSFEYGTGVVYGTGSVSTTGIQDIEYVHTDQILLTFVSEVVVDGALTDPTSYTLLDSLGNVVEVQSVRTRHTDFVTEISLFTNTRVPGETYTLSVSGLQFRDGSAVTGTVTRVLPPSKATNMFNAVPDIYDLRPNSPLRVFFEAVGREDSRIGGAESRLL